MPRRKRRSPKRIIIRTRKCTFNISGANRYVVAKLLQFRPAIEQNIARRAVLQQCVQQMLKRNELMLVLDRLVDAAGAAKRRDLSRYSDAPARNVRLGLADNLDDCP